MGPPGLQGPTGPPGDPGERVSDTTVAPKESTKLRKESLFCNYTKLASLREKAENEFNIIHQFSQTFSCLKKSGYT